MTTKENTGNCNTGYWNTGDRNTGDRNTGDWNTGYCNTGDCNTGDYNTGYWNTGDRNTGNRNTGYWNTGYWNTGDCNTGNCNTGNWNTGNRNTGNRNTGDWNTGDWNTGYCNTVTPEDILVFNRPTTRKEWNNTSKPNWMYVSLTKWISESDMSDKEKDAFPTYVTTGGYLKSYTSMHHAYIEAWESADEEDRAKTFKLPNFDAKVFEEIFGFNPSKEVKKTITIDGKDIDISLESFNELKKQITKEEK